MKKLSMTILTGLAMTVAAGILDTGVARAQDGDGNQVYASSSYTASTRRVGMVGGRPYPTIYKQVTESVVETADGNSRIPGLVKTRKTIVSKSDPVVFVSEGGTYYTSTGEDYYAGNSNIRVVETGHFRD